MSMVYSPRAASKSLDTFETMDTFDTVIVILIFTFVLAQIIYCKLQFFHCQIDFIAV